MRETTYNEKILDKYDGFQDCTGDTGELRIHISSGKLYPWLFGRTLTHNILGDLIMIIMGLHKYINRVEHYDNKR